MPLRIGFATVLVLLFVCTSIGASTPAYMQQDAAYECEVVRAPETDWSGFTAAIGYDGYEYLKSEEDKKASIELRKARAESIPPGGVIIVLIEANIIELARGEDYLFIVTDANNDEVSRQRGSDKLPKYKITDKKTIWYCYQGVMIKSKPIFPLKIRIVQSSFPADYWEYRIIEMMK